MPKEFEDMFPQFKERGHSLGSGVIIDDINGYIVTNNHVVERAESLIANGDHRNMFVAVTARLNAERGKDALLEVRDLLVQACKKSLAGVQQHEPIALSVEVQPIDSEMRINENSIRDYFEELT